MMCQKKAAACRGWQMEMTYTNFAKSTNNQYKALQTKIRQKEVGFIMINQNQALWTNMRKTNQIYYDKPKQCITDQNNTNLIYHEIWLPNEKHLGYCRKC